jgi:hypothetical protein
VPEDATHICQIEWREGRDVSKEFFGLDSNDDIYIAPNCDGIPDVVLIIWLECTDSDEEGTMEFQLTSDR